MNPTLEELAAAGVRVTKATECWGIQNSQRPHARVRHGSASHQAAMLRSDAGPSAVLKRKHETRQFIKNHGHRHPPKPKQKNNNGKKTFGSHRPIPDRPTRHGSITVWNDPRPQPREGTAASGTKIPTSGGVAARAVPE